MALFFGILLCLPLLIVGQTHDIYNYAESLFPKIDVNNDGVIVITEMEHFMQAFDDDGDGRMSRQEYISHVTQEYGNNQNMYSMLDTLYNGIDLNHDHHVDTADFDLLFNLYDRNHNGQVTKNEFTTFFTNFMSTIVG